MPIRIALLVLCTAAAPVAALAALQANPQVATAKPPVSAPEAEYLLPKSGSVTVPALGGIIFDGRIDGQGPFKMMLDSGSVNLLSTGFARHIGLHLEPSKAKVAAGGGMMDAQSAQVESLQIGDLTIRHEKFLVIDTPWEPGDPVGALGYELLKKLAVTIDFEHQWLTFAAGPSFAYTGPGIAVPLIVQGTNFEVKGSVDGVGGTFLVDTGNEFGFSLSSRFVTENSLIDRLGAHFHGYSGRGYAGPLPYANYARTGTLKLGDAMVKSVVTYLNTGASGPDEFDGNVGQSILQQFVVTFDVPHGKLYLEKNGNWGKPGVFNRAGVILGPTEPGIMQQGSTREGEQVMTVLPGSPGEAAGVRVGDTVMAIDSRTPSDTSQEPAFLQAAGTTVHLTLKRGQDVREVDVVLKDLL
jgi:predicted aspartyl protease